jgi:hypothetical protein
MFPASGALVFEALMAATFLVFHVALRTLIQTCASFVSEVKIIATMIGEFCITRLALDFRGIIYIEIMAPKTHRAAIWIAHMFLLRICGTDPTLDAKCSQFHVRNNVCDAVVMAMLILETRRNVL